MESDVQKFYKGCNVFITGGTGFLGKTMIEKLLRSTEVSTIYLLIREKKGKNVRNRLSDLLDFEIFNKLKYDCPTFKDKLVGIPGDCAVAGFGLSKTDKEKLIGNVHIVFHIAATVKFDENLKLAYSINVQSTAEILNLAKQMKQLKSIVHVSTAYSHCYRNDIDERFYDAPDYEKIEGILMKLTKNEVEELTPSLIGKWPNTYTFTKALAEKLVRDEGLGLPIGVFRPAIVISTYKEPMEGWADNMYGPMGIAVGAASGVLRVMYADLEKKADLVPVDTCISALIVSAKDISDRFLKTNTKYEDDIPIYNYVSSAENPITWKDFVTLNVMAYKHCPFSATVWAFNFRATPNYYSYIFYKLFLHILPALLLDTALILSGQAARFTSIYRRVHKLSTTMSQFSLLEWNFTNKNVVQLWNSTNETDKKVFPFSMANVQWLYYFKHYVKGLRVYLMKDPMCTVEAAKSRQKRFAMIQSVIKYSLMFFGWWILWKILGILFRF